MSMMLEVYYRTPSDANREEVISREALRFGGKLTHREESSVHSEAICLTYEFSNLESAGKAAEIICNLGEHIEGPYDYGQDR